MRVRELQRRDDDRILPQARSAFLDCGERTDLAVVLLHGFTNHPGQYRQFAPMLAARHINVLIPRLPKQGDRDRMTTRLASLTAEELLARAATAVDIACGLGDRVCVAGISTSGLLSAYFGQYRGDVARSVVVSPLFAMLKLPYAVSAAIAIAMRTLPNAFFWWDPRIRDRQRPSTAYPRFPTRALGQAMRVGSDVYATSRSRPFAAGSISVLTNRRDPAVNNAVTDAVVRRWQARKPAAVTSFAFGDLPENHDIIDPDNPNARTKVVYPRLLEEIVHS